MKISVVIPALNEEKLLPKTLASLQALDRKPDEILVVDASSTDKTVEISKNMGAHVITVPKGTIGFSRQKGIETATGDVIAFTDADALLPHDWLNRIEGALTKTGVVGYFGGFRVFDGPPFYRWYINAVQPRVNEFLFFPHADGDRTKHGVFQKNDHCSWRYPDQLQNGGRYRNCQTPHDCR